MKKSYRILPKDSMKSFHISLSYATKTNWWYARHNEPPRKLVREGRMWKCVLPCIGGMQEHVDDDFKSIVLDLKLSGYTIWNSQETI